MWRLPAATVLAFVLATLVLVPRAVTAQDGGTPEAPALVPRAVVGAIASDGDLPRTLRFDLISLPGRSAPPRGERRGLGYGHVPRPHQPALHRRPHLDRLRRGGDGGSPGASDAVRRPRVGDRRALPARADGDRREDRVDRRLHRAATRGGLPPRPRPHPGRSRPHRRDLRGADPAEVVVDVAFAARRPDQRVLRRAAFVQRRARGRPPRRHGLRGRGGDARGGNERRGPSCWRRSSPFAGTW